MLQTNTSVSPKSLVSGGNRQHLMEHCPGSPSPLLQALGGTKKKQKNWRETERGEGAKSVKEEGEWGSARETRQDELCKAVRGSYCWRCCLCWREPALISTSSIYHSHHSPWLSAVWSVLRQTANNKMVFFSFGVGGVGRASQATWWQVNCLGGTTSTLFIIVIYRGHQRGDLSWYIQPPCGNIITGQRLSEYLPLQHSGQRWLLLFCFVTSVQQLVLIWEKRHASFFYIFLCIPANTGTALVISPERFQGFFSSFFPCGSRWAGLTWHFACTNQDTVTFLLEPSDMS